MTDSSILNTSSLYPEDSEIIEIPVADPFVISPMLLAANTISNNPPDLTELAGSSKQLQIIAQNLHKLFSTPGYIKYSAGSRKDLETIFCSFIYEATRIASEKVQSQASEMSLVDLSHSQEQLKVTTDQLMKATKNIENITQRAISAEKSKDELKQEIKELQEDIENLLTEKEKSTQKNIKEKRDAEISQLKLTERNDALEEKLRSVQDTLSMNENAKVRLENQLDEFNVENAKLRSEVFELKSKLSSKSSSNDSLKSAKMDLELQVQQLETTNQELSVSINDYKRRLESSQKNIKLLSPERINQLEMEKDKIQKSLVLLMEQFEPLNNELTYRTDESNKLLTIVHRLTGVNDTYDREISRYEKEIEQLKQSNNNLHQALENTSSELKKCHEYESFFKDIKKSLGSDFVGDDMQVSTYIKNLLNQNQYVSSDKMQRLYRLIENQVKFLANLISTDQIDLFLLTNRDENYSLAEDQALKDQVMVELARIRQFLSQNNYPVNNKDDKSFDINNLTQDREILDMVSSVIFQTRVIQDHFEKLKNQSSQNMTILQKIIDIIQFNGIVEALPNFISETFNDLNDLIDNIKEAVGCEESSSLLETVQNMVTILNRFDTKTKEILDYDGEIQDLPDFVCDFIETLKQKNAEGNQKMLEKCRNQFVEKQEELELLNSRNEVSIKNMQGQIEDQTQEIKSLKDAMNTILKEKEEVKAQFDELSQKQSETSLRYSTAVQNTTELQNDVDRLRSKNARIQMLNDQKQKQFEDRLNTVLAQEKAQHEKEIESLKASKASGEEKFLEIIGKLKARNQATKTRLKEVMESYEEAFKKQKSAVAAIKLQNDELAKELSNVANRGNNETDQLYSENLRLQAFIKSLQSEKQCVIAKMNQLSEKCDQIQIARDNYWASQIAMKEVEFRKRESSITHSQNSFIQDIISKIASYAPKPIDISPEYTLSAISSLTLKLEDDESIINKLQNELLKKPPNTYDLRSKESEWEKWGRDTYASVTDGDLSFHSPSDLRYILGEMVISSVCHRKTLRKMESLRYQKKLLKEAPVNLKSKRPIQFLHVIIVVMAARKIFVKKSVSVSILMPNSP